MTDYICRFLWIVLILLPFYVVIRRPFRRRDKREGALAAFILFTAALLTLAFEGTYQAPAAMFVSMQQRLSSGEKINLIPFHTIRGFFCPFEADAFMVNIVGNIVMFMPWGFGLVFLWQKNQSSGRALLLCFVLTALIETGQLFIDRSVDVDDLILNFVGGGAGAALWAGLAKRFPVLREFALPRRS